METVKEFSIGFSRKDDITPRQFVMAAAFVDGLAVMVEPSKGDPDVYIAQCKYVGDRDIDSVMAEVTRGVQDLAGDVFLTVEVKK